MIDIKWLMEKQENGKTNLDQYREDLKNRGESLERVDQVLNLNLQRKEAILSFENKRAEQKQLSKEFAAFKKQDSASSNENASARERLQTLSSEVKDFEKKSQDIQAQLQEALSFLPNRLSPETPIGKSEEDNVLYRSYGSKPEFSFSPKEHDQIGESRGVLDFERAGKVSGSRFVFLRRAAAQLERALIQFMLDKHVEKHGYEEVFPPLMVGAEALYGTGNFPKFKEDVFKIEGRDSYLIPTAEIPLTNMYSKEILSHKELPKKFVAYTPCFRSEAGSYGKDTKGLIRQHQFNKIEIVKLSHPEESQKEHELLLSDAESILKDLELHYEVVTLCSGDISFGAQKCYDINVWLSGQEAYREISSCSNFGDFQARRANIRFRAEDMKKPKFVHTLNGSGLAVGRTLVAVLENYQQEDGSVKIPEVLVKYMGGKKEI